MLTNRGSLIGVPQQILSASETIKRRLAASFGNLSSLFPKGGSEKRDPKNNTSY